MFDWLTNAIGNLFGKKKEEEKKKPVPVVKPAPAPSPLTISSQRGMQPTAPKQQVPTLPTLRQPGSTNSMVLSNTPKPVVPKPVTAAEAPKVLTPAAQQQWADKKNQQANIKPAPQQAPVQPKPAAPVNRNPEKGTAVDFVKNYLNPFGENGIFGRQSIAKNTKIIDDTAEKANKFIDSNIDPKSANGKFDSPWDVARFAAKLPVGIVQAPLTAPKDVREATVGKRLNTDDAGKITSESDLTGLQRGGAATNALINTGGLALGGSGTLLKSLVGKGSKEILDSAATTGASNMARDIAKEIGKDSLKEGAEEGVQSFATDLQETGRLDEGSFGRAVESAALGAAGGGIMSGAGKVNAGIYRAIQNRNNDSSQESAQPSVVQKAPENAQERAAAVQNGVVTPETKHLSVDEQVQTALNSDIGKQVQYRRSGQSDIDAVSREAMQHPTLESFLAKNDTTAMTNGPTYQNGRNTDIAAGSVVRTSLNNRNYRVVDATPDGLMVEDAELGDLPAGFSRPSPMRISPNEVVSVVDHVKGDVRTPRDIASDAGLSRDQLVEIYNQTHGVQNRIGTPGGDISRADMQQVQLDNNFMFGTDAPNVDFRPGVMLTPDGEVALGKTVDTPTGHSQISISRQQGDARATNLHEAVHKALNDYMTSDERAQVVISYINDKRLGNPDNLSQDDHIRAAEELMAEDFIQYVANRNNQDIPAPNLQQRISDVFERVFKRLQLATAKLMRNNELTPEYQQFYNDLYSGEYANKPVVDKSLRSSTPEQLALIEHRDMLQQQFDSATDPTARKNINKALADINEQIRGLTADSSLQASIAYRIDPDKAMRVVETFKQLLKAPTGKIAQFGAVSDKTKALVSDISGEKVGDNASIIVESRFARHFNKHTREGAKPLTEGDIANLTEVVNNPDSVRPGNFVRGHQRVVLTRQLENSTSAVVEVIKEGDALNVVTYFNESPRGSDAAEAPQNARPQRGEPIHDANVANSNKNGNTERYRTADSQSESKPKKTRALRNAVESVIHDKYPKHRDAAMYAGAGVDPNSIDIGHGPGVIPKLPVQDLERHFGKKVASTIPSYYKTKDKSFATGGADQIALDAGKSGRYANDVNGDEYMDAWMDAIEKRSMNRQDLDELRQLRQDPEIIKEAQKRLADIESDVKSSLSIRDAALKEGDFETALDADKAIAEMEDEHGLKSSKRFTPKQAAIYHEKYENRVAKFEEFTASKVDAEKLADMAPQLAKVEEINSKTRKLHMPGGDTAVKVDVSTPRSGGVMEFAVRSTIDPVTDKSTIDLVPLDGSQHTLKNGMVVDKNGKSVGSYASIDDSGNQIAYIEGKPVNISAILGDIEQWGNLNKTSWDMDRLIELNAPDKATARRVQKFITQFKDQQESMMKTELLQRRTELQKLEKDAYDHLPKGIKKKELREDLFSITEKKANYAEMVKKYGQDYMDNYIKPTVVWWRKTADSVLSSTNSVLEQNGYDEIPRLDNYITHIQADPNFWEKVGIGIKDINPLGSSISSDIEPGKTRGAIPEEIVGKTENTGVRRRWNPFAQVRRGSQHEQDFFKAIDSYFEPMLFNKYMTPAASRTRVVERTFRTFEKAKELQEVNRFNELAEEFGTTTAQKVVNNERTKRNNPRFKSDRRSPMITAWQEYGNILAGKTNAFDRMVIDKGGAGGAALMTASTKAQGVVGASTIPGSATAALAQVLSIPQTIGRDSFKSFARATSQMITFEGKRAGSNDPLRKSAFMRARYTDASSQRRSLMRKYTNKASQPMEMIERAASELSWRSAYNEALSKGLNGKEAISAADVAAKKTLAGRGIGDRPYVMNSKSLGVFTQFGLEVNNMRVQYWNDFTPQQKIKFTVSAFAMNAALQAATGNAYLPDYIKAIFDSMADFENDEDDKKDSPLDNAKQALQRFLGETSKFVPGASSIAGVFMSDKTKEQVFGKNMDMSRFGTPAASRAADPLWKLFNGDFGGAISSAASLLPTGTQAKRTLGGVETLNKGYVENTKGNVQHMYDNTDPLVQAQAAIFGKYSIPGMSAAMDSGRALDKTQSEVFRQLYEKDPAAAKKYFDQVMGIKVQKSDKKGTPTDIGYKPDSAGALDVQSAAAALEADVKIKEGLTTGDIIQENGVYFTKGGSLKTDYYKELAKSSTGKGDSEYKAYLLGYGLAKGTKYDPEKGGKSSSSGNSTVDKLENLKNQTNTSGSTLSSALSLFKGEKSDVPDWVKDRYYKEAGWTKDQVGYAAQASYNTNQKLDGLYRPLAQQGDRKALLDTLYQGRTKSIANTKSANDAVITAMYKEGYISNSEQKYLKSLTLEQDGSQKISASSSSGRGKGGGKGVSNAEISAYLKSTSKGGSDIASLVKKYGSMSSGGARVKTSSPRMRSLAAAGKSSDGKKSGFKRKL